MSDFLLPEQSPAWDKDALIVILHNEIQTMLYVEI